MIGFCDEQACGALNARRLAVELNLAEAVARAEGPNVGLASLEQVRPGGRLEHDAPMHAVTAVLPARAANVRAATIIMAARGGYDDEPDPNDAYAMRIAELRPSMP